MIQYNIENVKILQSDNCAQNDNSKSIIKDINEVSLRLSSNMFGNSNDEINYPRQLSLIHIKLQIKLIISNKEMVTSLKHSGLLMESVTNTIENIGKKQTNGSLNMLLDTLGARFLGNMLVGKSNQSRRRNNQNRIEFLIPPHPLTNYETQNYY